MEFMRKKPGDILWSHAVNNREKLKRVLDDPNIDVIESDILLSGEGEIICAHPPEDMSDLTAEELIDRVKKSAKGLKLDFKQYEVVAHVFKLLQDAHFTQFLILNADILQGNNATSSKFDPHTFIHNCRNAFPGSMLSLGWTTTPHDQYNAENIQEMLNVLQDVENVTFPIRAHLIQSSWEHLQQLLEEETYTLSLWNNEPIGEEAIEWIRQNTDPARTFYDFIDEDKESIRLF